MSHVGRERRGGTRSGFRRPRRLKPAVRRGAPAARRGLAMRRLRWIAAWCALTAGCHQPRKPVDPVVIDNPWPGTMAIAVAPAINLSGSGDFDPNRFADAMARELGYAERIRVVPVSRVLAALSVIRAGTPVPLGGRPAVQSPEEALELVRLLGVDAVLVFAVTDYDPYDPPSIGITGQLYGRRPEPGFGGLDPVALSRASHSGSPVGSRSPGLLAQTQHVFDADHESVVNAVRAFAEKRGAGRSVYGWRAYLVAQEGFIEYCCHATVASLLGPGRVP